MAPLYMFCWLNVRETDKLKHRCHLEEKLMAHNDLVKKMWDDFEDRRIDAAAEARNNMPELE